MHLDFNAKTRLTCCFHIITHSQVRKQDYKSNVILYESLRIHFNHNNQRFVVFLLWFIVWKLILFLLCTRKTTLHPFYFTFLPECFHSSAGLLRGSIEVKSGYLQLFSPLSRG